jgi:hypothetical protein
LGLPGLVDIFVDLGPTYRIFVQGFSCEKGIYKWTGERLRSDLLRNEAPRAFVQLVMDSKCRIPVYLHATVTMPSSLIRGKEPPILPSKLGKDDAEIRVESNISANQKRWSVKVGTQVHESWGELQETFIYSKALDCFPVAVYADMVTSDRGNQVLKVLNPLSKARSGGIGAAPSQTAGANKIAELWL